MATTEHVRTSATKLGEAVAELRAFNAETPGLVPVDMIEALEHILLEIRGHALRRDQREA